MTRRAKNYPLDIMLDAIKGSGGITLTVAQRLQCDWMTAQKYINKWETSKTAFEAEGQQILDIAESVLERNIRIAYNQQRDPQTGEEHLVDTSDAKWILSRKGKERGYADKSEVEVGTAKGSPFAFKFVSNVDDDKL